MGDDEVMALRSSWFGSGLGSGKKRNGSGTKRRKPKEQQRNEKPKPPPTPGEKKGKDPPLETERNAKRNLKVGPKSKPGEKKEIDPPLETETETDTKPDLKADPSRTPEIEADAKPNLKAGPKSTPEEKKEIDPPPETEADAKPDPKAGPKSTPEEKKEIDPPLETETDAKPDLKTDPSRTPEIEADAKPKPESRTSRDAPLRNVDPSPWYLPAWGHANNGIYQYVGDVRNRVESLDSRSIGEVEDKIVRLEVDSLNQAVYLGCLLSLGVAVEDLPLRCANNTLLWDGNDSITKMSVKDVCEYATMANVPELSADYKKETNSENSQGPEYKTLSPYFLASDGDACGFRFTVTGLPSVQYSTKTVPIQDLQPSFETTAHVHRKTYQLMWMIDGDILRIFSATRAQLKLSVESAQQYLFYKLVE